MLGWMWMPIAIGIGMLAKNELFGLLPIGFGSLGLIGLVQVSRMFALGIAILRSKVFCEIESTDRYLYCTERMGWTSWKRKKRVSEISRLEIVKSKDDNGQLPEFLSKLDEFVYVKAVCKDDSSSFSFAIGYDESTLLPLAQELALGLNKAYEPICSREADGMDEPDSTFVAVRTDSDDEPESLKKPTDSKIQVIREGDSIAFSVPPAGKRGTRGLWIFSIAWLAFTTLFSAIVGFSLIFTDQGPDAPGVWGVIGIAAFLLLFFAVGIAMLLGAINMAKRTVMIGIDKGMLFIERKSIFRTKWIEFDRKEIASIRKGPSGMSVNNVPIMELQIVNADGVKQGLLSQLSENEISWLATELKSGLGMPSEINDQKSLAEIVTIATSHPNWPSPPTHDIELVKLTPKLVAISTAVLGLRTQAVTIVVSALMVIAGLIVSPILYFGYGYWVAAIITLVALVVVGCLILYFALSHSLTRFDIIAMTDAKNDSISVLKRSFLEKRQYDFPRESDPRIEVVTNETQVNSKHLFCLRIKNKKTKLNIMSGHHLASLRYVAAHLAKWIGQEATDDEQFADQTNS